MPKYIALLRAINVGGRNKIAMSDLRTLAESIGLKNPATLLQSGNLVFEGGRKSTQALERLLETETQARLSTAVDYCVRTANEWDAIIDANPFPTEAKTDPSHLLVLALKSAVDAQAVKRLQAAIKGREVVRGVGMHLYMFYPDGIGTSRLTNAVIEKQLDARGTARNWNTVLKLGDLVHS